MKKYLKDNKHNNLHLASNKNGYFSWTKSVLEAHSFPRASLSENCSFLETDNVLGQISVHTFAPSNGYCLYRGLTEPNQLLN